MTERAPGRGSDRGKKTGRPPRALGFVLWLAAVGIVLVLSNGIGAQGIATGAIDVVEAALAPGRDGTVKTVHVQVGDVVAEGAPLVTLSSAQLELELTLARAALSRAEQEVLARGIEVGTDSQDAVARLEMEVERASLEVQTVSADAARDQAELAGIDVEIARQRELVEKRIARADELRALELRRGVLVENAKDAKARLQAAQQLRASAARRLQAFKQGDESADKGAEQRVGPERAAVNAAREQVKGLEDELARLTLRAPFAGVVGALSVVPGGSAAAGAPALTISAQGGPSATVYVDEDNATRVAVGDRVELRPTDGVGAVMSGVVRALGPAIVEVPPRFRQIPSDASFGRAVFIALNAPAPLPGQAVWATFERPSERPGEGGAAP